MFPIVSLDRISIVFRDFITLVCCIVLKMLQYFLLVHAIPLALAGTILWDGRFNDVASTADLNKWSWTNQVGPYQYYIVCPPSMHT